MWKRLAICAAAVGGMGGLWGCAVNPQPAFHAVDDTVYARLNQHVQWNTGSVQDAQADDAVKAMLRVDLTADAAVQIALLHNRQLQATFEEIGIAQADLVQAGLLRNPEFAASWRLPDRSPRQTDAEYAVSADFLELLILPLRKKVAQAALERTQVRVADAVLQLAAEVKRAVYTLQAQEQLVGRLQEVNQASQAAAELSNRQHAAGTINDLDLANQQTIAAQSALDVAQAELDRTVARERLQRLMGLADTTGPWAWKVISHLGELPTTDPPAEGLETRAVEARLDLAAARNEVASLATALGITRDFRYIAAVKVGVDTEHNPGGPNVTGPTLALELPIFDQGQARIATAEAVYRAAQDRLAQQTVEVRSDVREAAARMAAQRSLAIQYSDTVLPQRRNILQQTLLHYNAMLKGAYDLLIARQNEVAAERAAIAASRDYWIARADLERAIGGRLP